jgi:signal transduction histidine kinase
MLERIVLNLISNAIKHTPAGGSIRVACEWDDEHVVISVKDNGEGIPEDKRELIFDRFRQVNTSLTRLSEGCGIGLSLCRSLVELLGGRIYFESTPGLGSEFFIELPLLQMEVQNANSLIVNGQDISERVQMELSDVLME